MMEDTAPAPRLRIGWRGGDPLLQQRVRLLQRSIAGVDLVEDDAEADVVLIGVPAAQRFEMASTMLRGGSHVFLEWPPTSSIRETARLVRLSEEAGLETGVSRPLRATLRSEPEGWRARIVRIEISGRQQLTSALADLIDLSFALVRSSSVQRVEAEADHDDRQAMTAAAVSIRFHSGALAQGLIRWSGAGDHLRMYAAGMGREVERDVHVEEEDLLHEMHAMVGALRAERPTPVSILDALHTQRVVERVMGVLR